MRDAWFASPATGHPPLEVSSFRRFAYRLCYVVLTVSGRAAARLAADFRTLGSVHARLKLVSVVLQTPVIACWVVVRAISLAAFAGCAAFAPAR